MKAEKLAAALWVRLAKCYALVLRQVRAHVLPSGLTLAQFDVSAQLLRHPEGMTPGDLSRALLVTAGNVTGLLKRLVSRGLVLRHRDPEDRRVVRLGLSRSGRRLAHAEVLRQEKILQGIFAGLPAADLVRIGRELERIRTALEESPRRGDSRKPRRGSRKPEPRTDSPRKGRRYSHAARAEDLLVRA